MTEPAESADIPMLPKDRGHVPLYTEHGYSRPRAVSGLFRRIKTALAVVLLAWWHFAPFIRWDRGPGAPDQAVLIDMTARRAYFFFIEIWPQEVYYLTGLLLMAGLTLFTLSAMAGRIWCGFLCWQTVYTDLFVAVERLVVGDRSKMFALEREPFSWHKIRSFAIINILWLMIAASTGIALTLYFGDAFQTLHAIVTGTAPLTNYVFAGIIGGFCYLLGGHARERVCVYMCPYSRFQSAMLDDDSLVVTYNAWRGEPRGVARKDESFEGRGHCIDCKACVISCPTGTDIRFGNQLSCIGCGLCIDACDDIMHRHNLPTGLISYESDYNIRAHEKGLPTRRRIIRPRTVIYLTLIAVVGSAILGMLTFRAKTDVDVLHERSPLFVPLADGSVRNGYTYKILNKDAHGHTYAIHIEGLDGAVIDVIGGDKTALDAPPDDVATYRVYVSAPTASTKGARTDIDLVTTREDGVTVHKKSLFLAP